MSGLKPCPFCGNEPIQDYKAVYCRYCFMMDEPDVRVDTWNTRPIEDTLQARITELEQQTIQYHHKKEDALQTKLDIALNTLKRICQEPYSEERKYIWDALEKINESKS